MKQALFGHTVITEEDCFKTLGQNVKGAFVTDLVQDGAVLESLEDRIEGRRFLALDIPVCKGRLMCGYCYDRLTRTLECWFGR